MAETPFAALDPRAYALPAGLEKRLHSPALVIFKQQVRANLKRMLALLGGAERWRPHLKTTKLPAIWSELLLVGVRHFKCATLREARHLARLLAQQKITDGDLLVAYPLVGPALGGLGQLAHDFPGTRFSLLVETQEAISLVDPALGIFIDLNPGMHRTGVPMDQTKRILELAEAAGSRFCGLHYYDGHLHAADLEARRRAAFQGYDELMALTQQLEAQGTSVPELITSGTPAFRLALAYPGFSDAGTTRHRVSPGTVVLHDLRSELENPGLGLVPAACLFSRVISHPTPDSVTLDAGSKSIAAEAGDPCAHVLGHPDWIAQSPSEEHLPLKLAGALQPARGTALWLIPMHVCPTVNLAEEVLLVDGEGFQVEQVVARAHDLLEINVPAPRA